MVRQPLRRKPFEATVIEKRAGGTSTNLGGLEERRINKIKQQVQEMLRSCDLSCEHTSAINLGNIWRKEVFRGQKLESRPL